MRALDDRGEALAVRVSHQPAANEVRDDLLEDRLRERVVDDEQRDGHQKPDVDAEVLHQRFGHGARPQSIRDRGRDHERNPRDEHREDRASDDTKPTSRDQPNGTLRAK